MQSKPDTRRRSQREMNIDVTEKFQHLPRAPIVEAVIEIRNRAETAWEEGVISNQLKPKLQDYPKVTSRSGIRHEVKLGVGQAPQATKHDLGWQGLWFQSADERQNAQFNRDGFLFSRSNSLDKRRS